MRNTRHLCMILILIFTSLSITANAEGWDGSYDNSYIYVANGYVNVRSAPNTNSKIIGSLTRNCIVPGLQVENNWIPINYNGYLGYVQASYLRQTSKPLSMCKDLVPIGSCKITGYDACYSCNGRSDGKTASGTYGKAGRTVAMKGYPYGSRIYIEGIGYRINEDIGAFGYNHVDVFCDNHAECYQITGYRNVYLVQ